jgi:hypothetical protein
MLNDQDLFDKVVTHVIKQGRPGMQGHKCMYLTDDGLKCAAGCLIPDGHPALYQNSRWSDLTQRYEDLGEIGNSFLIQELQFAHDAAAPSSTDFVNSFKFVAGKIADRYNLAKGALDAN